MFKKIHFSSIDSTHKWAVRSAPSLAGEKLLITADFQTGGVGRKGHPWISPPNQNLLATLVFPIEGNLPLHNLAQLLAFSAITVLKKLTFAPLFKWPNDLLLNYKKVAGVMVEIKSPLIIASIGLNVNMPAPALSLIDQSATSLLVEKGPQDLSSLKDSLLTEFHSDLTLFQQEGFAPFFPSFSSHLAYLNTPVTINNIRGHITGLHPDGRLILQTQEGSLLLS